MAPSLAPTSNTLDTHDHAHITPVATHLTATRRFYHFISPSPDSCASRRSGIQLRWLTAVVNDLTVQNHRQPGLNDCAVPGKGTLDSVNTWLLVQPPATGIVDGYGPMDGTSEARGCD